MNKQIKNQTITKQYKSAKRGFWAAFLFYFLIAFEFAYMTGPFATFFYSAYSPALNFFNKIPILSRLTQFFLPHVSQNTSSQLISAHNYIGAGLAISGFLMFCIGACRIYYSKLTKKGAVTGGIYKYIRHPQYISFIICSFGLLLIWPRYIVLVSFVTMLFVYYFLARAEEQECSAKFGESYIAYMNTTNMFIPFIKFNTKNITVNITSKTMNIFKFLALYIVTLLVSLSIAYGLQNLTINSLYSSYTDHSATISLSKMDEDTISQITTIAKENTEVQTYLNKYNKDTIYLNYILPTSWFAAEVPMNGLVYRAGHKSPDDYDKTQYKIIFTEATLKESPPTSVKDVLTHLDARYGIVEVWVDLKSNSVTKVLSMPENIKYNGIPEAIY